MVSKRGSIAREDYLVFIHRGLIMKQKVVGIVLFKIMK